jgi:hypothetical protein
MNTDKRSFYVWILVLLANIGTTLGVILMPSSDAIRYSYDNPFQYILSNVISPGTLYVLGISLFLTVVPVLISKANNKWVRRLGYGVPILLLLPIPYFIYDFYTCTGKFCQLGPVIFGWACVLSAIVISIFYTLGRKTVVWSAKVFRSIIWIVVIFFIGFVVFFGLNMANNASAVQSSRSMNQSLK